MILFLKLFQFFFFFFLFVFVNKKLPKMIYDLTIPCNNRYYNNLIGNILISNCIFQSISHNDSGGSISITGTSKLYILLTIFSNIQSLNDGGAIYFIGNSIQINKLCGNNCKASKFGQLFFTLHSIQSLNFFNYTSLYKCSPSTNKGQSASFYSRYGNFSLIFINSTYNHLSNYYSGMAFWDFNSLYGIYLNIFKCSSDYSICLHLHTYIQGNLSFCNLISTLQLRTEYGPIEIAWGTINCNFILNYFILKDNNGSKFISRTGSNGNIYILNSQINHLNYDILTNGIISQNCSIIYTNSFNFNPINYLNECYFMNLQNKITIKNNNNLKILYFYFLKLILLF